MLPNISYYFKLKRCAGLVIYYFFRQKTPMTNIISMRLPHLGEISYEVRRGMQRLAHLYAIMPLQLCFLHESNKLKK